MRSRGQLTAPQYRALRPRSLLVQLGILLAAEILLFGTYSVHDARFHWATHFLVAVIVASLGMTVYLHVRKEPGPPGMFMTLLVLHLLAMAPDLLFRAGIPHALWMDVFLGHVSAHYIPGGDTTWLLIAVVTIAVYTAALTRWLRRQALRSTAAADAQD